MKIISKTGDVIAECHPSTAAHIIGDLKLGSADYAVQYNAQETRDMAKTKIEANYPTYKQLNLLRSGTQSEKDKMDAFINACRDWSNGENPDPAALEAIQP